MLDLEYVSFKIDYIKNEGYYFIVYHTEPRGFDIYVEDQYICKLIKMDLTIYQKFMTENFNGHVNEDIFFKNIKDVHRAIEWFKSSLIINKLTWIEGKR